MQTFELPPVTPPTTGGGIGSYDVSGVKLGMPLREALEALQPAIRGAAWRTSDYQRADPVFGTAKVFEHVPDPARGAVTEAFVIFYDDGAEGQPVVAVGRKLDYPERNLRSDAEALAAFGPPLTTKYGKAFAQYADKRRLYWTRDPLTLAKLRIGLQYNDPCSQSEYRNFMFSPASGSITSQNITLACGEMVGANIFQNGLTLFLFDTTRAKAMISRAAAAPAPASEPEIKF